MVWSIFVYTVVPTGALLSAMLLSGKSLPMWAASKVLSTPLTFHNLQYSLGAVMTAVCLALSYMSYLSLRRCEWRAEETSDTAPYQDQLWRDVFRQGRNLYLSLLGLTVWAVAWRAKVLYDSEQLHYPMVHVRRRSLLVRFVYTALGLGFLLLADIPICRINYNLHLATFVTPKKQSLLTQSRTCEGIMLSSSGGMCGEFCKEVRQLSEERHNSIMFARNWHVLGRYAAELFDDSRGVQQGAERIKTLFEKKSCVEVLRSVDRSNQMVNYLCIVFAGISLLGAFSFFASVLHDHTKGHAHAE